MTGCPTALSQAETALLQRLARDRTVVEAGALLGYSTIRLAEVSPAPVVSIDRHGGYSGDTKARFLSNLDRAGVRHRVHPVIGEAVAELARTSAAMAFIDLTGEYDLTMNAARAAQTKIVAIHDYGRFNCPGVARAVKDLRWPVVERADTLIVLAKLGN